MQNPLTADQVPFGIGLLTDVVATPAGAKTTTISVIGTVRPVQTIIRGVVSSDPQEDTEGDIQSD